MDTRPRHVLIVTGEQSGDMRAASLVHAIRAASTNVSFFGIGGDHCRKAGVDTFADITELAVFGFAEVLFNIRRIKRVFDLTIAQVEAQRPTMAILVDYPGFNLRLARELKKRGIKVIYYVSPQIWAWKESRVNTIKQVVDRMMVLFPFEKDVYARHGYCADFVGHPLVDETFAATPRDTFLASIGLDPRKPVLGILPGSRPREVANLLGLMLRAAALVKKTMPDLQLLVLKAKNLDGTMFSRHLGDTPEGLKVSEDYYNALNACSAAIVCSGTATLETGLLKKPMVVVYKTSWATWLIGRMLIKISRVALVNILAGRKVVEELLQNDASVKNIARETLRLFDPAHTASIQKDLEQVKQLLGSPGASFRAARIVLEELSK